MANDDRNVMVETWISHLQIEGYRITRPRRVLIELLVSSTRALGPIDLFNLGRERYPGLGLVTVYRTLEKLEELGLIQRVHQAGGCHRYLKTGDGHVHVLICTSCGRFEYFHGDKISGLINVVSGKSGYRVENHWLQLMGLCPECLQVRNGGADR